MSMLLAFRFLQGGMGSTGSSVVGGTLSDLWVTSERGTKMSLLSLVCFLGNSKSPRPFFMNACSTLRRRCRTVRHVMGRSQAVTRMAMDSMDTSHLVRRLSTVYHDDPRDEVSTFPLLSWPSLNSGTFVGRASSFALRQQRNGRRPPPQQTSTPNTSPVRK
jgi:hypothetical protein